MKGKIKRTIYSTKSVEELFKRLEILIEKQEARENKSLVRSALDFLKKPVIGKPRGK